MKLLFLGVLYVSPLYICFAMTRPLTHWFPLPLLHSPFPATISPAHFGFGLDEGSATLLCSWRKEARIAQEIAAIFQPLEFFHSLHLILCTGLVLPLLFGFARVHFLKTKNQIPMTFMLNICCTLRLFPVSTPYLLYITLEKSPIEINKLGSSDASPPWDFLSSLEHLSWIQWWGCFLTYSSLDWESECNHHPEAPWTRACWRRRWVWHS